MFFFENEEMQNVKKTISESTIFGSTTVVVVKNPIGRSRRSAAKSKKQEKCDPHARRERWAQSGGNNNNYIYEIISFNNNNRNPGIGHTTGVAMLCSPSPTPILRMGESLMIRRNRHSASQPPPKPPFTLCNYTFD